MVDVGYSKHFRVFHGDNEFARDGHCPISGIESFWSFTKWRLAKFNGVSANFELHIKESEGKNNLMNLLVNYGNSSDIINSASLEPCFYSQCFFILIPAIVTVIPISRLIVVIVLVKLFSTLGILGEKMHFSIIQDIDCP